MKGRLSVMKETLKVKVQGGYLVATVSADPDYPGIDVEYISEDDNGERLSRPRVLVECPPEGALRALIWNNPHSEDYEEEVPLL